MRNSAGPASPHHPAPRRWHETDPVRWPLVARRCVHKPAAFQKPGRALVLRPGVLQFPYHPPKVSFVIIHRFACLPAHYNENDDRLSGANRRNHRAAWHAGSRPEGRRRRLGRRGFRVPAPRAARTGAALGSAPERAAPRITGCAARSRGRTRNSCASWRRARGLAFHLRAGRVGRRARQSGTGGAARRGWNSSGR